VEAGKGAKDELGGIRAEELLEIITNIVIEQQSESLKVLSNIEEALREENIHIIDESGISAVHHNFIKKYFIQKVSPALVTIILNNLATHINVLDSDDYQAVKMIMSDVAKKLVHIEMSKILNRFVVLYKHDVKDFIIMIVDLQRNC